ncbi:EspA/EspE family type VII secretion system effector [Mycobacterium sp. NPDC003449]
MGALNALYLDSNYIFGIADHANGMKSSVPWAAAGMASDFGALMQSAGSVSASALGATQFAAAAATPIINGGLIALTVAGNALGFGRPEDGERFSTGANHFMDAHTSLAKAAPPEDWQGEGSDAYRDRNEEQRIRAADMSSADEAIQKVLAAEAEEVDNAREFVSKRQTSLALCIAPAIALNLIPGAGPGLSIAFQSASVLATVPFAMDRIEDMVHHSTSHANEINNIASAYDPITATETPGGSFNTP